MSKEIFDGGRESISQFSEDNITNSGKSEEILSKETKEPDCQHSQVTEQEKTTSNENGNVIWAAFTKQMKNSNRT